MVNLEFVWVLARDCSQSFHAAAEDTETVRSEATRCSWGQESLIIFYSSKVNRKAGRMKEFDLARKSPLISSGPLQQLIIPLREPCKLTESAVRGSSRRVDMGPLPSRTTGFRLLTAEPLHRMVPRGHRQPPES